MQNNTSSKTVTESIERVKTWLDGSSIGSWIKQLWPSEAKPRNILDSEEELSTTEFASTEFPSTEFDTIQLAEPRQAALRSEAGPSDEDLNRIERGSVPSLIDVQDPVEAQDLQLTVREEEHPVHLRHDITGAPETIGDELAQHMLRSATGDDDD